MKKLLLMGLMLATVQLAQAQTQYVAPGKVYTFTATAAEGGGTISYQWFRNGEPISGATSQNYLLPDNLAYGISVEFTRSAVSDICPGNTSYTNPFTVTFCDLFIGGICWASANVAAPNKFAPRPDMYTQFYQWNRLTAWAATGDVSGWNSTADNSETWTVNPCPVGWRLPMQTEVQALTETGSTWAVAHSSRGNAVNGRFYGPNSGYCALPDNMTGCIFMAANGFRNNSDGVLHSRSLYGNYWSGTQHSATNGYDLYFGSEGSDSNNYGYMAYGMTIRCVQ